MIKKLVLALSFIASTALAAAPHLDAPRVMADGGPQTSVAAPSVDPVVAAKADLAKKLAELGKQASVARQKTVKLVSVAYTEDDQIAAAVFFESAGSKQPDTAIVVLAIYNEPTHAYQAVQKVLVGPTN